MCELLLAPQSGALRISTFRDFHPNPLIAFEHLSLSIVIWDSACRPRQINALQCRAIQTKAGINFAKFYNFQKVPKLSKLSKLSNLSKLSKLSTCDSVKV